MSRIKDNHKEWTVKHKKNYFEGWYFKNQLDSTTIAFIPGINIDRYGKRQAFIQIIMNENSYYIPYDIKDCKINYKKMIIKIGNTVFYKKGIFADIESEAITVKGRLYFGTFQPIRYPIMGVFGLFPFMECKHDIISMNHSVKGTLVINDKPYNMDFGKGYLEKDRGHSFPRNYYWLQCNSFSSKNSSFMISIADIPYMRMEFRGCICVVNYRGREYRFATYLGVKIVKCNEHEIILKQGKYLLIVKMSQSNFPNKKSKKEQENDKHSNHFSYKLLAPSKGSMIRTIHEQHYCNVRIKLYHGNIRICTLDSHEASLEIVE